MTNRQTQVQDWATDFNHTDPGWVTDPYPIWDDVRERPVAHTTSTAGCGCRSPTNWCPRWPTTPRISRPTQVVVSRAPAAAGRPARAHRAGPAQSAFGSAYHAIVRKMLSQAFAPRTIDALEPFTRELCRELLDATAARFDAAMSTPGASRSGSSSGSSASPRRTRT